ncbi:MAG: hypothetical protein LBO06_02950 [Bacteroidales bacterium]|jgi:hypothetical protein|nr:hypothetical protein [Bacteroidales bacterium]
METSKTNFNGSDANFNVFQTNLMTYLLSKGLAFTITTEETTTGKALQAKWNDSYAKVSNPATKTPVATQAKNDARKDYVKWLRLMVDKYIAGNDKITNDVRRSLGLTVKDTTPTPKPIPTTIPFMEINVQKPLEHSGSLWSNTFIGEKRKKQKRPTGVAFALVRWIIADKEPVEIDDMKHIIITSDSKFTLNFAKTDKGKKVYYTACWCNSKGQMGDWGKVVEAIIN